MSTPWSLPRRVAFRAGFVLAILIVFPFPLGLVPGTSRLAELLTAPSRAGVMLLARLLGLPAPSTEPTGSGDTLFHHLQLLLFVLITIATTALWSLVDRRPRAYTRLAGALRVALRYWLGTFLLVYGVAKLYELQFVTPPPFVLDQRLGDKSPMGLLWAFMGASRPYTIVTGVVEIAAGALVIGRRTATLGAWLAVVAMTQVVILNLCYDVPVKLFSMQLLAAALALAAPSARRMIAAGLGHAVAEVPPPPRGAAWIEASRRLIRAAVVVAIGAALIAELAWTLPPPGPLDGTWQVDRIAIDGLDRAPLATDGLRWQRFFVWRGVVAVRVMTDAHASWRARIDVDAGTMVLMTRTGPARWTLGRPDRDHLILDGALDGHRYHVGLARAPDSLLLTRGFHWIQERPFHR